MWSRILLKNKTKALLIHIGISALIFIPFLYLIWVHWFPPPMFFTDGGWQGVRIMLVVDVVIGPSLTFLIFNPAKSRREKLFDFTCIGLVQAAALVYGYMSVEGKRIQAIAFYGDGFYAVTKDSFAGQEIAADGWQPLGDRAPYWVYVRDVQSAEEEAGAMMWEFTEGVPRHELHFLYEPLTAHWSQVTAAAIPWTGTEGDAEFAALCAAYAEASAGLEDDFHCLGLRGYFAPAILVFDADGTLFDYRVGEPY